MLNLHGASIADLRQTGFWRLLVAYSLDVPDGTGYTSEFGTMVIQKVP